MTGESERPHGTALETGMLLRQSEQKKAGSTRFVASFWTVMV